MTTHDHGQQTGGRTPGLRRRSTAPAERCQVRASAALGCRRALWYAATGYQPVTNPAHQGLPHRDGGGGRPGARRLSGDGAGGLGGGLPPTPRNPEQVAVRIGPGLLVTGHPDGTVLVPLDEDDAAADVHALLFGNAAPALRRRGRHRGEDAGGRRPSGAGERWVRNAAIRRRWPRPPSTRYGTLRRGCATRSLPSMDTGSRTWDYEVVPAQQGRDGPSGMSAHGSEGLAEHHARPERAGRRRALPERDFSAGKLAVRVVPLPRRLSPGCGRSGRRKTKTPRSREVTDEEARDAVAAYCGGPGRN